MKLHETKQIKNGPPEKILRSLAKHIAHDARDPTHGPSKFWIKHLARPKAELLARNYGGDVDTILKTMVKYAMEYLQGEKK